MKDRTTFSFRLPIFRPVLIIPLFFVFCSLFLLETIATATIGGTIILETVPPGATVLLDFQEKGKTPLTIKDIPQGKHLLTIDLRHYHRVEKQLQVYAGQTIKQRHVLKHLLGFLNVKTDPPGARVKLIGKNIISKDNEFNKSLSAVFVGITPLFKPNVIIGRYTLEVSLENYQTYRKKFNLAYGQEKNFDIKLKGLPGKLKLTTTPRQARVFINGKIIGKTNFIKELNPGTYLLHIKRAGYLESKMEVVVESQKTTELNLKLHKTDVGEIVVKTVPEGAKVYIDSQRKGNTPLTLKYYAEGEYRISLEKPGYYTIDKMIRVEGGETTLLEEQMERQVATLDVTTEPSGAKILLDNSPIGFSPLTVSRISVGEHVLRARMTGYLDYLKQFYIYEKQYLNIQAKMDPLPGKLRVISSPPGANVTIDNYKMGITPGTFQLNVDKYKLRITMPGYKTYQQNIEIFPEQTSKVKVALQSKKVGSLRVETVPPGASVFLNGEESGRTPLSVDQLDTGIYQLKITMKEYNDYEATIDIRQDKTVKISERLFSYTGELEVTTIPEGVEVFIDGRSMGKAPYYSKKVPVGKHELRLSLSGYADKVTQIEINQHRRTKIQERLAEKSGQLLVRTNPTRAKIYVDRKLEGYSGNAVEIKPGLHNIRIAKDGYRTVERKLQVNKGEEKLWVIDLKEISSGNLVISSIPPGSEVYLDNIYRGLTPLALNDFPARRYYLQLKRSGYSPLEKKVDLKAGQTVDVLEELNPATGRLFVSVQPMGSRIFLDGKAVGISPLYLNEVMAGRHEIRIEDSRFKTMVKEIEVLPDRENRFEYNLRKVPSEVFIFSSPVNANIWVNGKKAGKTNATLTLKPGVYEIMVEKFGYTQYTKTVNVPVGKKIDLDFQLHKISLGGIYVTSTPLKAEVFLNGEYRGQTPLRVNNLKVASYEILISKEGYQSYRENFNLEKGKTVAIHKNLKTLWAMLYVKSKPYGAKVFLDNNYIGHTPVERYRVSVGWHKIRVKISGYEEWTDEFTIKPGDERLIKIRLKVLERFSGSTKNSPGKTILSADSSVLVLHPSAANEEVWKTEAREEKQADSSPDIKALYDSIPRSKRIYQPITLDNYQPEKKIEYQEVSYAGERLPGAAELFINSRPPGAAVNLSLKRLGTTPLHVKNIPQGSYLLELTKKNFQRFSKTISLKKKTLRLTELIHPYVGTLYVMSYPEGANIFIDGTPEEDIPPIGITPHGISNLIMGKHILRLEMKEFPPYEQEFSLKYGEEKVIAVPLRHEILVKLKIDSNPPGAEVYIDGENQGSSPVKVELKTGRHLLKLVKHDYQVLENWVEVSEKQPHQYLKLRLKRIFKEIEGMAYIPEGEFIMGWKMGTKAEQPPHTVYLKSFYLDKFEVTAIEYQQFMEATGYHPAGSFKPPKSRHGMRPATGLTWADANAYAQWAHKRLPTEAEWEKAARGNAAWHYPWGNAWTPNSANSLISDIGHPVMVGSYPKGASPYGIEDMAGNVWEWCADWFSDTYYTRSPRNNPEGPEFGSLRTVRGGSFGDGSEELTTTFREGRSPGTSSANVGFRCAKDTK